MNKSEIRSRSSGHQHRKKKRQQLLMDKWPLTASCYKLEFAIGQGNFGLVWKAHCFDLNSPRHLEEVAIKIISLDRFDTKKHSMEDMRKEINIISKCNHPNVLKYFVSFLNQKELWLVMPLIEGGSLH